MTDTWEDEGGFQELDHDDLEYFDWPYDEDLEEEDNLLEDWDELEEVDDYKYIEERQDL